jgi:cytoskeletal protein CcmA (bactofilin family)
MFSSGRKKSVGGPARPGTRGLSFIGPDVLVTGDVVSAAQLHIDGRIDGNVRCETLVQGDGGTIAGHIVADNAHLAGLVDGTVKARVVTLEASARVTGDVTYETLSIAAGGAIEGRLARREGAPVAEALPLPAARPELAADKKRVRAVKREEPALLALGEANTAAAAG